MLEVGEIEDEGHSLHIAVPGAFLYFPATHPVHGPAFGPVYPALQEQPKDVVHAVHALPE